MDKVDIRMMTQIQRKPEEVMRFVQEPASMALWLPGIHEVKLLKGNLGEVGAHIEFNGGFLGMKLSFTTETTEVIPNAKLVNKGIKAPFPMEYHYILEPIPEGTRMTLNVKAEPGGFFKLAQPLVEAATKRTFQTALENLKEIAEEQKLVEA